MPCYFHSKLFNIILSCYYIGNGDVCGAHFYFSAFFAHLCLNFARFCAQYEILVLLCGPEQ